MKDWSDSDGEILHKTEEFLKVAKLMIEAADLWTDQVGHNIDPDSLEPQLRDRVQHIMWKGSMLKLVLEETNPAEALANVIRWASEMGVPGMVIHEVGSKEEAEAAAEAMKKSIGPRKEENGQSGYL